jgi:hypothetical protein
LLQYLLWEKLAILTSFPHLQEDTGTFYPISVFVCFSSHNNIEKNYDLYLRFYCLFTLTSDGRVPVSPLIPYNIKFVQRGFSERTAFEEGIPRAGRGFTVNFIVNTSRPTRDPKTCIFFNTSICNLFMYYD